MEWVKSAGGILLLLGGIYFLKPLLPFMRHLAVPETWFLLASLGLIAAGLALDLAAVLRAARVTARGKRRSRDVAAFLLDAERHVLALVRELCAGTWQPRAP